MDDPTLTQRLYDAGAVFTKEVQKTASPLLTFFLTAILPLLIFVGIGQYMSKKLMEQAGGKNSMMLAPPENPMPRSIFRPLRASIFPT